MGCLNICDILTMETNHHGSKLDDEGGLEIERVHLGMNDGIGWIRIE